ncbi:MAG: rod shape-determining protein MreC [Salinivirgaceae bacterium]|nr:rod shape-determining protein MreC [Salinivirgaceae bacterium]MDD4745882.1 rod shape-determining protein MreC [Salinivirgaceae bacterium]
MKNLIRLLVRYHLFFMFLALEAIAFGLLFQYNRYHRSSYINASTAITGNVFSTIQKVKDYMILAESNKQLAAENAQIKNTLAQSYKSNRISFKEIYDSIFIKNWEYVDCKIVFNSTNKQNNILIIDKGLKHGIKSETGLITDRGIIGIVRHASDNYSSVMSLLNVSINVSAKLKKSGHFGTLQWDGVSNNHCWLSDIPTHITINNGDTVVSSGYSTIFPEGIIIGVTEDINRSDDMNFFRIKVRLLQDFGIITHAYVVQNIFKEEIDSLKTLSRHD